MQIPERGSKRTISSKARRGNVVTIRSTFMSIKIFLHVILRLVISSKHGVHVLFVAARLEHVIPLIPHVVRLGHDIALVVPPAGLHAIVVGRSRGRMIHHLTVPRVMHRPRAVAGRIHGPRAGTWLHRLGLTLHICLAIGLDGIAHSRGWSTGCWRRCAAHRRRGVRRIGHYSTGRRVRARWRRGGSFRSRLLVLLDVRSGVGQMTRTSRIATSNRAFLEVTLQDITPGERIIAQNTHVRSVTGVCVQDQRTITKEGRLDLRLNMWRFKCLACR